MFQIACFGPWNSRYSIYHLLASQVGSQLAGYHAGSSLAGSKVGSQLAGSQVADSLLAPKQFYQITVAVCTPAGLCPIEVVVGQLKAALVPGMAIEWSDILIQYRIII